MVQFIKDNGICCVNGKLIHADGHAYEREWLDQEVNFYSQKGRKMKQTRLKVNNNDMGHIIYFIKHLSIGY